jgi:predicted nucleotidyltransferase
MNNPFGIYEKSFELIIQVFNRFPEIEEVIIYGSRAKGNYKKGSDIDLAIKGTDCSIQIAFKLSGYLNDVLPIPYKVDVANYNTITNPELKSHIDRVGKIFYKTESLTKVAEPDTAIYSESKR